jgi:hypothetical protein
MVKGAPWTALISRRSGSCVESMSVKSEKEVEGRGHETGQKAVTCVRSLYIPERISKREVYEGVGWF